VLQNVTRESHSVTWCFFFFGLLVLPDFGWQIFDFRTNLGPAVLKKKHNDVHVPILVPFQNRVRGLKKSDQHGPAKVH
jgi:hypothetical protein